MRFCFSAAKAREEQERADKESLQRQETEKAELICKQQQVSTFLINLEGHHKTRLQFNEIR